MKTSGIVSSSIWTACTVWIASASKAPMTTEPPRRSRPVRDRTASGRRTAQQPEEGAESEADQGGAIARGQAHQPGRHHAEAAECGKHAQGFARQDANLASGQRVF
jgi:hypothetical protein